MIRPAALALILALAPAMAGAAGSAVATFAAGCFWCAEADFEHVDGVTEVISGYTGGDVEHPSYQQVSFGGTGHAESVEVHYDPDKVSYEQLLTFFWHDVDPYTPEAQFCDHGHQYRSAIFWHDEQQRAAAEASKAALEKQYPDRPPIATEIVKAGKFWPAEDYHQGYAEKNPVKYRYYRWGCGRDKRLKQLWGDQSSGH